ncbi:desulfoferrodoxin FeS4 iron-binding domain-containing protein [Nanoarchaeota archaeon]
MAERTDIFKCNMCGHMIEVIHKGSGDLVCCGEKMEKLAAKTQDEGKEKHVPVTEMGENGLLVKVGSVEHPMEQDHYIEWIQVIMGEKSVRRFLKPGDKPEVKLPVCKKGVCDRSGMVVREFYHHKIVKKRLLLYTIHRNQTYNK